MVKTFWLAKPAPLVLNLLLLLLCLIGPLAQAETHRTRGGGQAVLAVDGTATLFAEGLRTQFQKTEVLEFTPATESVRIAGFGPGAFSLFKSMFDRYVVEDPDQIINGIDWQIIYGEGVTCARKPNYEGPHANRWENYFEIKESELYRCHFTLDRSTGETRAMGIPESRGRIGVSNGGGKDD